jgi:predicted nucleotidyltransferase component of viral defense system
VDLTTLVPMLARHLSIRRADLLEKDIRLHLLLGDLAGRGAFSDELLLKGGTCLIKCYLGYPRFSEDLDFTWGQQDAWSSAGTKNGRTKLRPVQREFAAHLDRICHDAGYTFHPKTDLSYGRSNRLMTASIRYRQTDGHPGAIRIQINFHEPVLYPATRKHAQGLLGSAVPDALRSGDEETTDAYTRPVRVRAYDPREILVEKARAVLTRQAAKGRDLLDLYLLQRHFGLEVADFEENILLKTRFSAGGAARYRRHLDNANARLEQLLKEDVRPLLIREIDLRSFPEFRAKTLSVLRNLASRAALP